MALEPLDLTEWVTRLRNRVDGCRAIELAATKDLVKEFGRVAPAVYVLGQQGRATSVQTANASHGLIRQRLAVRVRVAMLTNRVGDALGGKAIDALRDLRVQVWDALIGWTPPGAFNSIAIDTFEDGAPESAFLYGVDQFYVEIEARKREDLTP